MRPAILSPIVNESTLKRRLAEVEAHSEMLV